MSTLFASGQLTYKRKLRKDVEADNRFFQKLLEHPSFSVGRFEKQHNFGFAYVGDVAVGGNEVKFRFIYNGDDELTSLDANTQDSFLEKLIAQVIIENAEAIPGVRASLGPVKEQPTQLKITKRTSDRDSSGRKPGTSYKDSFGYLGEKAFVEFWKQKFPEETVDWPNEEDDAKLPYDVIISRTLTVDVKATRSQKVEVQLSQHEIDFHSKNKERHVIALVTFDTIISTSPNRVLLVDLYMGHPLRSVALADVARKVQELEPLQLQVETAPPVKALEPALPYLSRGTYASEAQELTLHANTYTLRLAGRHGEVTGPFYLRGNQLVLQEEGGKFFTVCKGSLRYGDDELKLLQGERS